MSIRKRADVRGSNVTGAGQAVGVIPEVAWGPDFGESSDDNTWRVTSTLTMPELALDHTKQVNATLTLPALEVAYNAQQVNAHLSGEVLGAPFWQAVATNAGGAAGNSLTVNVPAGTVNGDLLLAFLGNNTAAGPQQWNLPAGWNNVNTNSISNMRTRVIWRIASSEPASYTFTLPAAVDRRLGEIHRINAAHQTTPIDANTTATLAAAALDPDPDSPSVTTTVVNTLVFAYLLHDHLAVGQSHTPAANHVERTDFQSGGATQIGHHTMTRVFSAIGATGTAEHNCTQAAGTDAIMHRVAVRPGTLVIAA